MTQQDNSIARYMVERCWSKDRVSERKRYLHRLARQSRNDPDIASKIGGMLIYNQVIEQFLLDIIDASVHYIKAEIWPVSVGLEPDLDKATFGKMIDYFTQYATVEPNRELILSHLKKFNIKRNQVVHDLFDFRDMRLLANELDEYSHLADEIIGLLADYDMQVCENLNNLSKRVDFRRFL